MRTDTLLSLRARAQCAGGLFLPATDAAFILDLIEAACLLHDSEVSSAEAEEDGCQTARGDADAEAAEARKQLAEAIRITRARLLPATIQTPTVIFIEAVAEELHQARRKFPGDRIMTIALAEEFGELAKAMLEEPAAAVWKEAVQTATMAARVAIDGDSSVDHWRREKGLGDHRLGCYPDPYAQAHERGQAT